MIKKIEMIKDVSIILDMVFTMIAVICQNIKCNKLSDIFFGISGLGLVLAFVCVIITLRQKIIKLNK